MKELIVILIVAVVLLLITAYRYRRQIQTAIGVWRMFNTMRKAGKAQANEKSIGDPPPSGDVELVRCARCSAWKPRNEALKFSRGTFYCSSNCVNEAMNVR
jgi:hypothetical protein